MGGSIHIGLKNKVVLVTGDAKPIEEQHELGRGDRSSAWNPPQINPISKTGILWLFSEIHAHFMQIDD